MGEVQSQSALARHFSVLLSMIAFRKIHLTILLFGVTAQSFGFKCGFNDSAAEEEIFAGANTRTAHETLNSFYDWPRNGEGKVVVPYVWVNATEHTREQAKKNFRLIEDRLGCVKFVESLSNQANRKELLINIPNRTCRKGVIPGGHVGPETKDGD